MNRLIYILLLLPLLSMGQIVPFGFMEETVVAGGSSGLHTEANAISIDNEANATTGWSAVSGTLTTQSSDAYDGTYAFDWNTDGSGSDRIEYDFAITDTEQYYVSIWYKYVSGGNMGITQWVGFSDFSGAGLNTSGTWTQVTRTVTANVTGTATIRFGYSSGTTQYYFDKIEITQL